MKVLAHCFQLKIIVPPAKKVPRGPFGDLKSCGYRKLQVSQKGHDNFFPKIFGIAVPKLPMGTVFCFQNLYILLAGRSMWFIVLKILLLSVHKIPFLVKYTVEKLY